MTSGSKWGFNKRSFTAILIQMIKNDKLIKIRFVDDRCKGPNVLVRTLECRWQVMSLISRARSPTSKYQSSTSHYVKFWRIKISMSTLTLLHQFLVVNTTMSPTTLSTFRILSFPVQIHNRWTETSKRCHQELLSVIQIVELSPSNILVVLARSPMVILATGHASYES